MNNGLECGRKNKRKASLVEIEKPTRYARVLLERLPSKTKKDIEKEKIILNDICKLSSESIVEEDKSNILKIEDSKSNSECVSLNLENLQQKVVDCQNEKTKNSTDPGKSKKKKRLLLDPIKIDKINLSAIVLLEKLPVDKLKEIVNSNKEFVESNNIDSTDDSLINISSQNNKIQTVEKEVKRFKTSHIKDHLDLESVQSEKIDTKSENINVQTIKSDEHDDSEQKGSIISVSYKDVNITENPCYSFKKKSNKQQKIKEEDTCKSIKNYNCNKKQKTSSHFIAEKNISNTNQVPCRQKSRTKSKKLILNNGLPTNKETADISKPKDNLITNEKIVCKEDLGNETVNQDNKKLKVSLKNHKTPETNTINSITNKKLFETQEKYVENKLLNNTDKCIFKKLESKSENESELTSQLTKYPKIYIKRICPSEINTNRNLLKIENLSFEKKSNNKTNKCDATLYETLSQDNNSKQENNIQTSKNIEQKSSANIEKNLSEDAKLEFKFKEINTAVQLINDSSNNEESNFTSKLCNDSDLATIKVNDQQNISSNCLDQEKQLSKHNFKNGLTKSDEDSSQKLINKISQSPDLRIENSNITIAEITTTSKQTLYEDSNIEKNTEKLLNSSGDSNHSSDDENFLTDSEESHEKEKFTESSCSFLTKKESKNSVMNDQQSQSMFEDFKIYSDKKFYCNFNTEDTCFEDKKITTLNQSIGLTNKQNISDNFDLSKKNSVKNKKENLNNIKILKKLKLGDKLTVARKDKDSISNQKFDSNNSESINDIDTKEFFTSEEKNIPNNELDNQNALHKSSQNNKKIDDLNTSENLIPENSFVKDNDRILLANAAKKEDCNNYICNGEKIVKNFLIENPLERSSESINEELIVNKEKCIEQNVSSDSVTNKTVIKESKYVEKIKFNSQILDQEVSNDSVIEKESIETDEVLDEDFSNDSMENKKIYFKNEFDSNFQERKNLSEFENLYTEPESREIFEIHLEQELSNDSALDDKLSEGKKISLDAQLIVNTEIYLEQEALSNDSGAEDKDEKKFINSDKLQKYETLSNDSGTEEKKSMNDIYSEQEVVSCDSETDEKKLIKINVLHEKFSKSLKGNPQKNLVQESSNDFNTNNLSFQSIKDSLECDNNLVTSSSPDDTFVNLQNEFKEVVNHAVIKQKTNINDHILLENSIQDLEIYEEQEVSNDNEELIVTDELTDSDQLIPENINEISENKQYIVGYKVEEDDNLENNFGKEILKDLVVNEHSYFKDENDFSSTDENDVDDVIVKNAYNIKINQKDNIICHEIQDNSSINGVVGKIQNELDNLKDQCSTALTKVTDIIRDCSFKIERDLNELKRRHENENINNEKLLVINLDESKDNNRSSVYYKTANYFDGLQINDSQRGNSLKDVNSEKFSVRSKFNYEKVDYSNEYIVDSLLPSIGVKHEEEMKHRHNLLNQPVRKIINSGYNEKLFNNNGNNVAIAQLLNKHVSKLNNDHTYAGSSYDQSSENELSDHKEFSEKQNLFPMKNINKNKSFIKFVIPDTTTENYNDDGSKMSFLDTESENGIEKDATINLKKMCKKIAARINPVNSNDSISNSLKKDSKKMPELLYIGSSNINEVSSAVTNNVIPKYVEQNLNLERRNNINNLSESLLDCDSSSKDALNNVPMKCPKCEGIYFGYLRMKKHLLMCGEEPNLPCPWCSRKLKYRQSLITHFLKFHPEAVKPKDAQKIADDIEHQARALYLKKKPIQIPGALSALGHMPNFLKLYCNYCSLLVDWQPNDDLTCRNCFKTMTINCQNCESDNVEFNEVNFHVKGQCAPVRVSTRKWKGYPYRKSKDNLVTKKHSKKNTSTEICSKGCRGIFQGRTARLRHERHCGTAPNRFCKFCPFKSKHRSAIKVHIQQHVLAGDVKSDMAFVDCSTEVEVENFTDFFKPENTISQDLTKSKNNKAMYENRIRAKMSASCTFCKELTKVTDTSNYCNCSNPFVFSCNVCLIKKSSYHPMRVHVIRRHLEKLFKCNVCWRSYSYYPDYKTHTAKCGFEPERICNQCNFRTYSAKSMENHKRRRHNKTCKLPTCSRCGKVFTLLRTLLRHEERYCGIEAKLSCEHCTFMTKSKFSLKRHIQSIHYKIFTNVRFECEICMKEFSSLYSRDTHAKTCNVISNPSEKY